MATWLVVVCLALFGVSTAAAQPGTVEPGFNPNANGEVFSLAVQADGKILLGGQFSTLGGVGRNHIARLEANGALDAGFNPGADFLVDSIAAQGDGKILMGGVFTMVSGVVRNRIARLNPDGALDTGFNPDANDRVTALAVQPDGKIPVGGKFTTVGGIARSGIARLHKDGALDHDFNPALNGTLLDPPAVGALAVQPDGRILIAGGFTAVGGAGRDKLARLEANGELDPAFVADVNNLVPSVVSFVNTLELQADGKILVGGSFTKVGGVTRSNIARLLADGTVDAGFNPSTDQTVTGAAVQADGKIIIGGAFSTVGGITRHRIARLHADGSLDLGFNPDANGSVAATAIQADGRILLGSGSFSVVGGLPRNGLARLENDGVSESLTVPSASRIEWQRGGALPESHQVTFELSTDGGISYSTLGAGARINGGWQLAGLSLPSNGTIRARARTHGGSSSGLVEKVVTFNPTALPGISVSGNAVDIADGDSSPGLADHTDFGSIDGLTGSVVRSFAIENHGNASLIVGPVTLGGAHPGDFTVSAQPPSFVSAGGSTTFQITFGPGALGLRSATVSFTNNDGDENPFNFSIQGAHFGPPTVIAPTHSLVTTATATLGGQATSDGGSPITTRGVVYAPAGTNANPNIGGTGVTQVATSGTTGVFTVGVTGLTPSTPYSFKAYATNAAGTAYTQVATFTTSDPAAPEAMVARIIAVNSAAQGTISNALTQLWYRARLFANRSYQLSVWPVDHEQGVDAARLSVSVFSDDAGIVQAEGVSAGSGPLEATTNQGGDDKPFTAVISPATTGVYKIRVKRTSGGALAHSINLLLRETTLFSPWTSRAAGYEGFVEMHNNTGAAIPVTVRAFDNAGGLVGTPLNLTLPANATEFRTATQIGVPAGAFAGIVLTHDGAFGGVSANLTTLNGATGLSFDSPFTVRDPNTQASPVR